MKKLIPYNSLSNANSSDVQQWNQLSRFQKNLFVVVIFAGILLVTFLMYQRQLLKSEMTQDTLEPQHHVNIIKPNVDTDKIQIIPFKVSIFNI